VAESAHANNVSLAAIIRAARLSAAGLDLCRFVMPHVVIADINMPGMSGYALAREIREHFGPLSPLLIGVSGVWTGTSDRLLGKVVGFDHYLLKPSDPVFIRNLLEPLRSSSSAKGGTKTE